jgi:hypothetical protein
VVAFLTVWLGASTAWANSAPLPVAFAPSARDLPEAAIRVAIGTELGREALSEAAELEAGSDAKLGAGDDALAERDTRERIVVAVDELGQLWVRYWGPRGLVDRHLAMPERPEQLPLVVSLAVGNLVRQEAFELLRDLERRRAEAKAATAESPPAKPLATPPPATKPAPTIAPRSPRARRASPPLRRNSWGHYLVTDFVYVPTVSSVCSPSSDISCYDASGDSVVTDAEGTGIAGGIQAAHDRYVMAYSRALTPEVWGTVRLGIAFSGGQAKNRAAESDPSQPRFWPWLAELRLQYFLGSGALNGALRPFVHATAGCGEAVGEVKVTVQKTRGINSESQELGPSVQKATAVHPLGLLYGGAGLGLSLAAFDGLRLETELSGFVAFPSTGFFLRPSIGATYDF